MLSDSPLYSKPPYRNAFHIVDTQQTFAKGLFFLGCNGSFVCRKIKA